MKRVKVDYFHEDVARSLGGLIGKRIAKIECKEYEVRIVTDEGESLKLMGSRWGEYAIGIEHDGCLKCEKCDRYMMPGDSDTQFSCAYCGVFEDLAVKHSGDNNCYLCPSGWCVEMTPEKERELCPPCRKLSREDEVQALVAFLTAAVGEPTYEQ